jgi:hypothetical protein
VRPERVPKLVAGRAFTVVRTARPLSKADRSRKDPTRAAPRCVKARFLPPSRRVGSRADAVGALPARNATAPRRTGRLVVGPIRKGGSMNKHSGIHPRTSPWRQPPECSQAEQVRAWRDPDERVFLAAFWSWRLHAACRGVDTELFYCPEGERGLARAARERAAKAICATLPGEGPLRRLRAPASGALRRLGWTDRERARRPVELGSGRGRVQLSSRDAAASTSMPCGEPVATCLAVGCGERLVQR